jgi:uncharacterized protein (TIGR03435 family)
MGYPGMVGLLLLIAALIQGQAIPPTATFEVASIKENKSIAGSMVIGCADGAHKGTHGVAAGRCHASNASLRTIIGEAYGLPYFSLEMHLSGLPAWARTEKYDIEAAASDPDTSEANLRLMLRNLLAERFKLKAHEETKEVHGFALVVAKGGLKAKPYDDTSAPAPDEKPVPMAFATSTIEGLTQMLPNRLGGPVVNKTNIIGRYHFSVPLGSFNEDTGPSLVTVLEEMFGLKLEPMKVPITVLVIDHVEKPVVNW